GKNGAIAATADGGEVVDIDWSSECGDLVVSDRAQDIAHGRSESVPRQGDGQIGIGWIVAGDAERGGGETGAGWSKAHGHVRGSAGDHGERHGWRDQGENGAIAGDRADGEVRHADVADGELRVFRLARGDAAAIAGR